MSSFLTAGGVDPMASILQATDERLQPEFHRWNTGRARPAPWTDGLLWPSSRMMCGDNATQLTLMGGDAGYDGVWGVPSEEAAGNAAMKKIIGTTRDANGNPLGNCVVKGFLTTTNQFLRQMTSDGAGYYEFCSEFPLVNHYLVAYLAGSPDVEGTTVNTLQPV